MRLLWWWTRLRTQHVYTPSHDIQTNLADSTSSQWWIYRGPCSPSITKFCQTTDFLGRGWWIVLPNTGVAILANCGLLFWNKYNATGDTRINRLLYVCDAGWAITRAGCVITQTSFEELHSTRNHWQTDFSTVKCPTQKWFGYRSILWNQPFYPLISLKKGTAMSRNKILAA